MKFYILCWKTLAGNLIPCGDEGLIEPTWETDASNITIYFNKSSADYAISRFTHREYYEVVELEI